MNYLRPNIKHGNFNKEEEETILKLHETLGNRQVNIYIYYILCIKTCVQIYSLIYIVLAQTCVRYQKRVAIKYIFYSMNYFPGSNKHVKGT